MLSPEKFKDPFITAKGETRASVKLNKLETLWFNTGTVCNLSCENCYIESSPTNDRLGFLTLDDVKFHLDEITKLGESTKQIGFTGGEPFVNPNMIAILDETLSRGFEALVLTNAYHVFNRHKVKLLDLKEKYGNKLFLRISLDHYTKELHERERGQGTFDKTLESIKWIAENNFKMAIAGRSLKDEDISTAIAGFKTLLSPLGVELDYNNPEYCMIFPEMDESIDVPEITTACWEILNKHPDQMMCANSRMIVHRKGEERTKVLACTLLAYDEQFELGETLGDAQKNVQLNHAHCAKFCVLGGASCSA